MHFLDTIESDLIVKWFRRNFLIGVKHPNRADIEKLGGNGEHKRAAIFAHCLQQYHKLVHNEIVELSAAQKRIRSALDGKR